jgi:hypothetical protein
LTDPAQYEQAESIWRARWESLLRDVGQETLWRTPWLNTHYRDGTAFHDGNPIFSAVSPSRKLGVRILQPDQATDSITFRAWTDTFAKGDAEEKGTGHHLP